MVAVLRWSATPTRERAHGWPSSRHRPWPAFRRVLRLGPAEPEHEHPRRVAQAPGATFLGLATIAFVVGAPMLGWLGTGAVAALQTLLARTGICVGCRLYLLRWWGPSRFAALFRRSDARQQIVVPSLLRVV